MISSWEARVRRRTRASNTAKLARGIAKGMLNLFGSKEVLNVDEVSDADPEKVDDRGCVDLLATEEPQEDQQELKNVKVSKEARNAVLRIHKNRRHPSKGQLVRAFRACGASDEAIAVAVQMECPASNEMNRPAVGHA
eukprot:4505872-Pyramimonas_sp.AAC.1